MLSIYLSFSAVSRSIFATKYYFFSIFRELQNKYTFAPLESAYGKNLEKPTHKPRRKLKSENNENANKQENNVVLQVPRRLIYTIRRSDSGAASHYQTSERGARSQLQREWKHPRQVPMHNMYVKSLTKELQQKGVAICGCTAKNMTFSYKSRN